MDAHDLELFFATRPELFSLYLDIQRTVQEQLGNFDVVVQKSQVTWKAPGTFAALWLPRWKRPDGRPYVGLSFFLEFRVDSPRIPYATEPYPNRWTHHTSIADLSEPDDDLIGWLHLSKEFSLRRRRRKP